MSLGSSLTWRNAGLAVPTPIYADANDSPIDLRKKVAIRRQRRFEYGCSDDDENDEDNSPPAGHHSHLDQSETAFWYRKNSYQNASSQYFLSLRNLHPVISEQYGIQYALFNSPEGTHVVPVPYSPFHQRSPISEYKHRVHPDHSVPNYGRSQQDSPQLLDRSLHYPDSKRYHSKNHWLSRNHGDPPTRVASAERRSSSPSPTEHFKKRHLKQSYWANQDVVSPTESPPVNGGGQVEHKNENSKSLSPQAVKVDDSSQALWLRKKNVRRRLRSYSCTDLRGDKQNAKKLYQIHAGYGSDSEITKQASIKSPSHNHRPSLAKNCHRPSETPNKVQKNQTLLNLLVGSANKVQQTKDISDRKKGIDVLLQHLKQNPVNHQVRRGDSYPWSVYEYYNHLVERSSRLNPTNYIPQSYIDHAEDDSANQQRKRPSRALTGKHVKHGTGASPSTLITLRQKIQERQKAKELMLLHGQPEGYGKVTSSQRNALSKKLKLGGFKRVKQDSSPAIYQSSKIR